MSCGCGGGGCSTCASLPGPTGPSPGIITHPQQRLAQRLAPRVDRLRQRLSSFGLRVYDVDLVWVRWSGAERGEGAETVLARIPILPTPKVEDLTAIAMSPMSAGILTVGSIRISEVSAQISIEALLGRMLPPQAYFDGCKIRYRGTSQPLGSVGLTDLERLRAGAEIRARKDRIEEPYGFFYEVVQNDVPIAPRMKYRLAATPFKRPGRFDWALVLEKISEDQNRRGMTQIGPDTEDY